MHRTRVKICGITREQDVLAVTAAGADAIGLVFYEKSPRHVTLEQGRALAATSPAFVTTVALFKDADAGYIEQVLREVQVDLLQFHGAESADFCRRFDRPWIKALGVLGETDILQLADSYRDARGVLLDAHAPGADGGTGRVFDWNSIPAGLSHRLVLAGGLNPGNVHDAINTTHPYAVDVSSGVESAPGIKSAELINEFMNEVRRADG